MNLPVLYYTHKVAKPLTYTSIIVIKSYIHPHGKGCCPGLRETTLEAVVDEISMTVVLSEKATAKIPLVALVQYTLSSSSARLVAGRPAGGGGEEERRQLNSSNSKHVCLHVSHLVPVSDNYYMI